MRKSLAPVVTTALLLLPPAAWSQSDRAGSIAGERDADTGLTADGAFDVFVTMELSAVVGGDGLEAIAVPIDQLQDASIGFVFGSSVELADC